MEAVRSEDTLIFFALSKEVSKISSILESVNKFFETKQGIDPTDRFNFIAFIKNKPVYLEDFTFNAPLVISEVNKLIPEMTAINMAGGLFVAITFIIDVFKIVGGKTFRLIILTDNKTPKLRNIEVVQDLIEKIVSFPFFVDIIRLNVKDPKEDIKLMRLAKVSGGNIYHATSEKDAARILRDLVQKKKIQLRGYVDSKKVFISDENEFFFENIAESPKPVIKENISMKCQICGLHKDPDFEGNLYKCGKCGVTIHRECLAKWANFSNVSGLPHLFRCQNCFNLIKLPKDFVEAIQSGRKPEEQIIDEVLFSEIADVLLEREKKKGKLKIIQAENPFPSISGDEDAVEEEKDISIFFCPSCGKMITTEYNFCSGCGIKLK
ncbi:MAG: hypothetical protein ACTSWY_03495 [Promethearchaeota archaeon]